MNANVEQEKTPVERLAEVCSALGGEFSAKYDNCGRGYIRPNTADYRNRLAPYVNRELAMERRRFLRALTDDKAAWDAKVAYFTQVGVEIENEIAKYEDQIAALEGRS